MTKYVHQVLDIFYPLVSRIFDKKTYYYAAVGSSNMLLSWVLFYFVYHFVFQARVFHLTALSLAFEPHSITSFTCSVFSFFYGFVMLKYVVFTESELTGKTQFLRYGMSAIISTFVNWVLLKLFVEYFGLFPSIGNVISTIFVVIISYLLQRKFTFKN
ncbi:MAG: hypothetical protein RL264_1077 [Bacteroidota bacterium]